MIKNSVYVDTLIGFIFFSGFAYLTEIFRDDENYYKVVGFLYGFPLIYYILFVIVFRENKKSIKDFSINSLLGNWVAFFSAVIFLVIIPYVSTSDVMYVGLTILFLSFYFYFRFKVYEKTEWY